MLNYYITFIQYDKFIYMFVINRLKKPSNKVSNIILKLLIIPLHILQISSLFCCKIKRYFKIFILKYLFKLNYNNLTHSAIISAATCIHIISCCRTYPLICIFSCIFENPCLKCIHAAHIFSISRI